MKFGEQQEIPGTVLNLYKALMNSFLVIADYRSCQSEENIRIRPLNRLTADELATLRPYCVSKRVFDTGSDSDHAAMRSLREVLSTRIDQQVRICHIRCTDCFSIIFIYALVTCSNKLICVVQILFDLLDGTIGIKRC